MKRFTRFSRISPVQQLRSRERSAWCSATFTGALLAASGCLLMQQVTLIIRSGDSHFRGIPYTAPEKDTIPPAFPVCRSAPPSPEPELHLPQPMLPDILLPDIEIATEPLAGADESDLWEDTEDGLPAPPEPKQPASSRSTPQKTAMVRTTAAAPLQTPPPPYPARMRQRRIEGEVGICIHIDAAGTPTAVDILTEVHPDFAEHTRRWILRHWRFRAAQQGSAAIVSTLRTSIRYRLDD